MTQAICGAFRALGPDLGIDAAREYFLLRGRPYLYGLPNLFAAPFACRTHLPDGPRTGDQQWIAHLSM
jgi:hypothetical protein